MIRFVFLLLSCSFCIQSSAQYTKIGEWSMHLNYTNINVIINENQTIYVGTQSGLFLYNETDNSVTRFSKLDGLSSLNVTALDYENGKLIVGYNDGSIDIIVGSLVSSIPHIASANILGNKKINHLLINGDLAYASCPFGIVVINIATEEIKETYYLSNDGTNTEVFETYVFDESVYFNQDSFLSNKIFAATDKGLFYANKYDNLLDFASWKNDCQISLSQETGLYTYPLAGTIVSGLIGFDKKVEGGKGLMVITEIEYASLMTPWVGDSKYNLFMLHNSKIQTGQQNIFTINNGVPGEIIDAQYNSDAGASIIVSNDNFTEKIIILNNDYENILSVNCSDISGASDLSITSATLLGNYGESSHLFLGDSKKGLFLSKKNSFDIDILEPIAPNGPSGVNIGSITNNGDCVVFTHGGKTQPWNNLYNYDEVSFFKDNYWSKSSQLIDLGIYDVVSVSAGALHDQFFVGTWNNGLLEFLGDSLVAQHNSENTNNQIEMIPGTKKTRVGGIDIDNANSLWLTNSQTNRPLVKFAENTWTSFTVPNLSTNTMIGKILCTTNGQKWIQLREEGILVAKENKGGVISRRLGSGNGLPSNNVNCFIEDKNESIWVGTSGGLCVFYFPEQVFNNSSYGGEYILIETEDGYVERLFDNTEILDIKVDGGNRKWIATKGNGVFLVSEDGATQIYNFTEENSFLLDNTVYEISINSSSGEVFFATTKGLCSYRSNSTGSESTFTNVLIFPNPVRKNYSGDIAISGLKDETNVKITDISGNLVFETSSVGGTATWDGRGFDGGRVSTGVYLFLCTSPDFEESIVKKILFYN